MIEMSVRRNERGYSQDSQGIPSIRTPSNNVKSRVDSNVLSLIVTQLEND